MAHAREKTGRTCIFAVKGSEVVREPGAVPSRICLANIICSSVEVEMSGNNMVT